MTAALVLGDQAVSLDYARLELGKRGLVIQVDELLQWLDCTLLVAWRSHLACPWHLLHCNLLWQSFLRKLLIKSADDIDNVQILIRLRNLNLCRGLEALLERVIVRLTVHVSVPGLCIRLWQGMKLCGGLIAWSNQYDASVADILHPLILEEDPVLRCLSILLRWLFESVRL